MKVDVFKIEITLGNDSMQTTGDVARALRTQADVLEARGLPGHGINHMRGVFDANGNVVGHSFLIKRQV